MAIGPGKYDEACTRVRLETGAEGVLLIVLGGDKGSGFACQATGEITIRLPEILEAVAQQIRHGGIAGNN
jgi:hypothetical protein